MSTSQCLENIEKSVSTIVLLKATSRKEWAVFSPQGRWMDKFAPVPRPEEIRQMIAKLEEAEATCGGCFINP